MTEETDTVDAVAEARAGCVPRAATWEGLESRVMMSAAPTPGAIDGKLGTIGVVYVETNNASTTGYKNAVLAYKRGGDGKLSLIGKYDTGGRGLYNPADAPQPDDSDRDLIVSRDRKFLYAVNQGSNSITGFRVNADGTLKRLPGAAVFSGGAQPVGFEVVGDRLFVVNKGSSYPGAVGGAAGNVSVFRVGADGRPARLAGQTVPLPRGHAPSQVLASPDGKWLFATTLVFNPAGSQVRQLEIFRVAAGGTLSRVPGSPFAGATPVDKTATLLDLAHHPTKPILYVGAAVQAQVSVLEYDAAGNPTLVDEVDTIGKAPCWFAVDKAGKYLYVTNTGSDSISVFSLADPLHPKRVQVFELRGPNRKPGAAAGAPPLSNVRTFSISPDGKHLFTTNDESDKENDFPGNQLHSLDIAPDGRVSEPTAPVVFSNTLVPAGNHPLGNVSV